MANNMLLQIKPESVIRVLLACIGVLLLAHLAGMVLLHGYGYDHVYGTTALFRFDGERNFPTMFSTLQLFLAAVCLALTGILHSTRKWHWLVLSVTFVFLSADEYIGFHELLAVNLGKADSTRTLQFAWLLPYLVGVILFALAFVPFLLGLPRRTAVLFAVAGGVFVSAAIGLEALTGMAEESGYDINHIRQRSIATVEEILEMSSISLFIYAVLDYLRITQARVTLSLSTASG